VAIFLPLALLYLYELGRNDTFGVHSDEIDVIDNCCMTAVCWVGILWIFMIGGCKLQVLQRAWRAPLGPTAPPFVRALAYYPECYLL
jgi:hypothetical protein